MSQNDYQPMPRKGKLRMNLNLCREALLARVAQFQKDEVRAYVVSTLKCQGGRLRQGGSAPNFQGERITLCSCLHRMRSGRHSDAWKGVWIAGYTCKKLGNDIFYLMMVSETFQSQSELWYSSSIPGKTRKAKAAHLSKFGDVYKPKSESGDPYSPRDYVRPCNGHVHFGSGLWLKDIDYCKGYGGRKPALLVGDPEYSFLWDRPMIQAPFEVPRNPKKAKLGELFPFG